TVNSRSYATAAACAGFIPHGARQALQPNLISAVGRTSLRGLWTRLSKEVF
ncbi:hypothetical protein GOODEAATRI_003479, partial [Goodea atripinnis]